MTLDLPPAPNGPLSLQGEGWGEGTASTQNTAAIGKRCSRASSLLRRAVPVLAWGLPARRAYNRGRGNGGSRWACQDDSEFTVRSKRPPLPSGRGLGRGNGVNPNTAATWKRCSRASSLLRRAVPHLALGLPARRAHNRGRGNGGSRWECQDDSEFTARSERPLSLWERAGVRERRQPQTLQPPGNAVREQARSYTKAHSKVPWGAASITSTRLRPLALARYRAWSAVL